MGLRRVSEYHHMMEVGSLTEDNRLELLEGYLVRKPSRTPVQNAALQKGKKRGFTCCRTGGVCASAVPSPCPTVSWNRTSPWCAGNAGTYRSRHPGVADIALVIEVAYAAIPGNREVKGRIYASAGIVYNWIVNVTDWRVEVYSAPSGPVPDPNYGQRPITCRVIRFPCLRR